MVGIRGWDERGELFRYRCGSFANVFSLRCICFKGVKYVSRCWGFVMAGGPHYIPDCVTSSQSNPLGNWSILFLGFRKLLLRTEGLVTLRLGNKISLCSGRNMISDCRLHRLSLRLCQCFTFTNIPKESFVLSAHNRKEVHIPAS
jgi:hypothetical protein